MASAPWRSCRRSSPVARRSCGNLPGAGLAFAPSLPHFLHVTSTCDVKHPNSSMELVVCLLKCVRSYASPADRRLLSRALKSPCTLASATAPHVAYGAQAVIDHRSGLGATAALSGAQHGADPRAADRGLHTAVHQVPGAFISTLLSWLSYPARDSWCSGPQPVPVSAVANYLVPLFDNIEVRSRGKRSMCRQRASVSAHRRWPSAGGRSAEPARPRGGHVDADDQEPGLCAL
jgi:hypothetical protein